MYRVFEALDELSAIVEEARGVPMTAGCVVPRGDVLELVDDIKDAIPGELDDAQDVLDARDAMLRDAKADIMLSGGRSQFVALKARMPWMDINQERHHAFAGYEGMVTMVAEIDKALFNPVWREVRSPAPWDVVDPLLVEA